MDFLYKNKYIDLTLKMKLQLYVKLYDLYKVRIDPKIVLKSFLDIEVADIFCNIVFKEVEHGPSDQNIEFLLTEVADVWDPINNELD